MRSSLVSSYSFSVFSHNLTSVNLRCITIFSKRITLKPISSVYESDIFREFTDEVAKYTVPQPSDDIADTRDLIACACEEMNRGTDFTTVVIDRTTGRFLGCAGLRHIHTREPKVGIWLAKSAQGRGIGKEVVSALWEWAEANLEYDFLYYPVVVDYLPSRRLVESLGGVLHGERKMKNTRGVEFDAVGYEIPRRSAKE